MTAGPAPGITDSCLAGGGEMGALMRAFDWSATALGPVARWPQSLKTAVSICLNSQFPMVLWWGPELTVLYNDGYIPILGIKHPARALGRPGHECWAEIWEVIRPLLNRVMTKGEANWADDLLLFINRSGYAEEAYFRFSYSPIRDESGGIGGVFTPVSETTGKVIAERRLRTLRDLSERAATAKESRDALRAAAAVLALNPLDVPFAALYLFNQGQSSAELIATAGIRAGTSAAPTVADARWKLWNAATAPDLSQITAAEALPGDLPAGPWGEPPETLVLTAIAPAGQSAAAGFMVAGVNSRRRLDAEYRSFFSLAAGQIGTAIANASAFEQERRRAEALAEIDRAKTLFFSNISHEFRTPLTLLLGPLENARSRQTDAVAGAELEIAHRNALRLLRLVNTLLDFSRIEAGRARASFEPVNLSRFTEELAGVFRAAIEAAGIRFRVECEPLSTPVLIDRDMWEKIVFNLLSNAWKFTFEGEIGVILRRAGERIELIVSDTGAGIPDCELPRIFDRFHRVEGTRARTHEGTGIGLSLVKELVALHQGEIRAESRIGQGSRFIVSIPAVRAEAPAVSAFPTPSLAEGWIDELSRWDGATSAAPRAPEPAPGLRARVLLADDNADMRDYASRLLNSRFEVIAAGNGEEALEAARANPPDLVLSDVMMPRLDGFGLLAALRNDPATRGIPVILLSARAGQESRIEGMEAGADDYLVKPFSALELVARVESHIRLAAARRQAAADLRSSEEFNRSIVESSEDSICVLNLAGELLSVNGRALAAAGAREPIGAAWTQIFANARADEAALALASAAAGQIARLEFPTIRSNETTGDETKWWSAIFSPIFGESGGGESGAPVRILAVARDISEQKRVEGQLLLLVRASATLLASTPETVVESIIRLAQDFVAADAYAVWRKYGSDRWGMISSSGLSGDYGGVLLSSTTAPAETIAVEDVLADDYLSERFEHYRREGIRSMLAAPLRSVGEVTGTLVFYYRSPHRFPASEVTICTALGNMASAAIETARLYQEQRQLREQAEEARKRAMFLAQAGAILASSLDVDRTLAAISELAVPEIADWCAVDLVEAAGPPRRVTVRHMNPALVEKATWLRAKYPPGEDLGFGYVLRSGRTAFAPEVTDEDLRRAAQSDEHLAGLRELGIRSCMLAPLIVHGEKLGVLTLVRSTRPFVSGDVAFIEEIAQRAAFAVHSARLHHAVSESAERLDLAAAAAGLGIFEWNVDTGTFTWENQRIFDIFQRTRQQGPVTWEEFFSSACHPDDRQLMLNEISAATTTRRPLLVHARVRREDGEWIWVEFSGQFDFTPEGRAQRLVGVVSDVTDRRRMEERLRERAKLESIGLLAGGVAHDFNNLLTGVLGNSSLALDIVHERHPARRLIEAILTASERAAALTQQMLAYSGRGHFVIEPVDISNLVREMSGLLRTSIDRSIELVLELESGLPQIEADTVQMQQVVMNLIINAAESMAASRGAVTIRTYLCDLDAAATRGLNPAFDITPGQYVCLEVQDQGCGMDEATMAKIFDPFFTTKFTGRGLGLSAVLGIVRGHKGSLALTSEPGKGTTFRIHLPPVNAPGRGEPARTRRKRGAVLVVDDEEIVRTTAAKMFEAAGFRVITAENGAEALRVFQRYEGRIDLTILDLSMPVMQGDETFERIRERWPAARIVISTGFAADDAAQRFRGQPVAGILQKPYTVTSVAGLIRDLDLAPEEPASKAP